MIVDTKTMLSVTDVNRNFSLATKLVDESGKAIILKCNKPKYVLVDIDRYPQIELTEDEKIEIIGKRILRKHINAFKELAKW